VSPCYDSVSGGREGLVNLFQAPRWGERVETPATAVVSPPARRLTTA